MRSTISSILITLSCVLCAPQVVASTPIQDVTQFARTTNPLTASQSKTLGAFIDQGIQGLNSNDPAQVIEAREQLVQPLTRVGTSPVFREAFGQDFIEKARPILEGNRPFNAHNALLVIANIRTGDAADFLARQLATVNDARNAQRIAASSMLVLTLRTTPADLIRPRQFNSIIRSITSGSSKETSWAVVQHGFEALVAIGSNPEVPEEIRTKAIEQEADLLKTTLSRIAKDDSVQLARCVSPMVLLLRSQFIGLSGTPRREFAGKIQPALVTIIEVGESAWMNIRSNAQLEKSYGDAIFQATVLARLVAGSTGAPESQPADFWRQGDRSRYKQTAQEWMHMGG